MRQFSNFLLHYSGPNPFRDSQSRNYSDDKLIDEFCPTANFWSLFNDQHEVIIGTRGSGKTFLLKMMRLSLLSKIPDPKAEQLVKSKDYLSFYIPLHLELVASITNKNLSNEEKTRLFQFAFNCLLAKSIILEIKQLIFDDNPIAHAQKDYYIAQTLINAWFNSWSGGIVELNSLYDIIERKYTETFSNSYIDDPILSLFFNPIGTPLKLVKKSLVDALGIPKEPTWIICIDEAEFLDESFIKCINTVFRSDSDRIAIKVATLPFYHTTLETLQKGVSIVPNNDFSYHVVDMHCDSLDFKSFTNKLCVNRITKIVGNEIPEIKKMRTLEDFVGVVGKDSQRDYFYEELKDKNVNRSQIEDGIIEQFSEVRKANSPYYHNKKKTISDKFAPVYFVREMFKLSKEGNRVPGWYAGSEMIRRISQGNPRLFIQIMNILFSEATVSKLSPKKQHKLLFSFSTNFCNATEAMEKYGPLASKMLHFISKEIQSNVHDSFIKSVGSNFRISYQKDDIVTNQLVWLKLAIAYSRLTVDSNVIIDGINEESEFLLSNGYAAKYWIPMRADGMPSTFKCSVLEEISKKEVLIDERKVKRQVKTFFPSEQPELFGADIYDKSQK